MKNSDSERYEVILFRVDGHLIAIEIDYLAEIVESMPVAPLPFVPAYVEGLVNVNGKIMPQVKLATLLFGEQSSIDIDESGNNFSGKTLLIVNIDNVPVALKIDQVRESYSLEASAIVVDSEEGQKGKNKSKLKAKTKLTKNNDNISSKVHIHGHFEFVDEEVIFFDALSLKDVVRSTAKPVGKQGFLGKVTEAQAETENFNDYLICEVTGKEYAIDLDEVNEIVIMDDIKSLPRTPSLVVGMGLVRGRPRLMLSMAALLGEPCEETVTAGAAIMVKFNDVLCGVLADKMVGLETITETNQRQNQEKTNLTIVREDGHTLTRVIRFSEFFNNEVMETIKPYLPKLKNDIEESEVRQIEMLRFNLDGDAYAIKLDDVHRVVSGKQIEPLLSEHGYLIGTMELEGKVVPVINLINQLGYGKSGISLFEYIVVNDGGRVWGLGIGETDQIIKVDEPMIDDIKSQDVRYVSAYSNYEDCLLTILNITAICHDNNFAGAA